MKRTIKLILLAAVGGALLAAPIYCYTSVSYEITTNRTDIGLEPPLGRPAAPHSNPGEFDPALQSSTGMAHRHSSAA